MTTAHRDVSRMIASYSRCVWESWAQARGLDTRRLQGPALQAELSRVLLSSASVKAALAETTAEERIALARLKQEGGKAPAAEVKAQLGIDGVKDPDAAFKTLMSRGLLFYDRSFEGVGRWELWGGAQTHYTPPLWLPREIADLVTIPEDLGRLPLQPAPEPPHIREASFTALQRDVYLLLQALRKDPIKLLKSGDVGKRDSERLLRILPAVGADENDPTAKARAEGAWFRFLWLLIQLAGLVQMEPGRMTVSEAGRQFLGQSEALQAGALLRAWANVMEWNEFHRVPTLEFEAAGFGDYPSPPQLVLARLTLIELLLRERPYPGWHSFPSLLASMQRFRVAFLIPRGDVMGFTPWGFSGRKEDRSYRGFHARGSSPRRHFDKDQDWEEVEGAYMRTLLEEPLLWLGIVRLGYVKDELVSFEFTERGAAALGLIEAPAAPPSLTAERKGEQLPTQRALVVQPNFEMVVYPDIGGISLLVELDHFAERLRMDRAALYRLTRADLCRGLQGGLTLAAITRTLEAYNAGPLPQNVAYSLEEWERLYNRIHVHRAVSLIEAADDAELRALRALPELANAREIAPRLLLVPPGAALRGLRPKPEVIDYTIPITHAIEFETATRLRVLQPTPRLLHRLQQVADPVEEGDQHGAGEPRFGGAADSGGGRAPGETRGKTGNKGKRMRNEAGPGGSSSSPVPSASVSPCLRVDSSVFELSREKVARAARWWKWEGMHAFLAAASRTALRPELAVILKGWAGALEPAAVTSMTLLAAPSAEWLEQVLLVPAVKRCIVHRLSPTLALVAEESRSGLEEALAGIGTPIGADVSVRDLLVAEARAAGEAGELLLIGPPRKRRALIEQAISERKRVTIAMLPYGGKLTQTKLDPVRIEGEGTSASLVARVEGLRYEQYYPLNRIQGVRLLEEPAKP